MAKYVCRKDGYDLTDLVIDSLKAEGMDRVNVRPVIEGLAVDEDVDISFLSQNQELFRESDEYERVRVICPKDDMANTFVVEV